MLYDDMAALGLADMIGRPTVLRVPLTDKECGALTPYAESGEFDVSAARSPLPRVAVVLNNGICLYVDTAVNVVPGVTEAWAVLACALQPDHVKAAAFGYTLSDGRIGLAWDESVSDWVTALPSVPGVRIVRRHKNHEQLSESIAGILAAVFGLLNCKNVDTEQVVPSAKLQSVRKARGRAPLGSYRVLKIVPFAALRARADGRPSGRKLAVHWVRGHIARYTDEAPLFGKYVGQYWCRWHLAGRNKKRFVEKDYEVVAS